MSFTLKEIFFSNGSGGSGGEIGKEKLTTKEEKQKRHALKKVEKSNGGEIISEKRYPVISLETSKNVNTEKPLIKTRMIEDYSTSKITPEEKSGYEHLGTLDIQDNREEEYIRSPEYHSYQNKKENTQKQELLETAEKVVDKLISIYRGGWVKKDDIILTPHMAEKKEPKKQETKKEPTKEALSSEDLKLQVNIYNQVNFWKNVLNEKTEDSIARERNKKELRDFNLSPYGWMKVALTNTVYKYKSELEATDNTSRRKELEKKISTNQSHIDDLDIAYEKNIPLKLEREFSKKNITLNDGRLFDVAESINYINKITRNNSKTYEVLGAVQRGNDEIIILKSDSGEQVDLKSNTAKRILEEVEIEKKIRSEKIEKIIQEKEDKFAQIKIGSIVQVRTGGVRGEVTTYKITGIDSEKVAFEDITARARGDLVIKKSMPIDRMKDFLFDKNVAFLVKGIKEKFSKDEVASTSKVPINPEITESLPETPEKKVVLEKNSPLLKKVVTMAEELGFMNALVIERDLRLPRAEAEDLYRQYQILTESNPSPLEKNVEEKAEPIMEKPSGPTSEQIARFENALMKKREVEARIKELETELKKDSEKNRSEVIKGEPENITQPIELSIDLPEGYIKEN